MKKIKMHKLITLCISALMAVLLLAACNNYAEEIERLERELELYQRDVEILDHGAYILNNIVQEQAQELLELDELVATLEDQLALVSEQYIYDAANRAEIIDSFMENLEWIGEFLGVEEFYFVENDIMLSENFITAYGTGDDLNIELVLGYRVVDDEITWELLRYSIGGFVGFGGADRGMNLWQLLQDDLFDESFTMRFYNHDDSEEYEYHDVEISPEDWQAQVISYMQVHTGILINDLWYEGDAGSDSSSETNRLIVDLMPAAVVPFDFGSTGSYARTRNLIDSLATLPDVTEIEVLAGGQRGVSGSHFSFSGIFRVDVGQETQESSED